MKFSSVFVFVCAAFAFLIFSCSIPNLEGGGCSDARTAVREFYSFHFGGDMAFSSETLELRKKFLTAEFAQRFDGLSTVVDPFTRTTEPPKAFRVGTCRADDDDNARFDVLLFWRTDETSAQQMIRVHARKIDNKWLIADVDAE
ncbi:MAG: hypothetical protein LC730_07385 [Acidobacteria bacterium]|nr:hypothetical protein [Acidobacteriota bacterium]MCA1609260.1 hypothetical protein [Acidobacteriota bacterium]